MVFIKQIDGAFKEIKKRLKKLIQICCTPRIKDMAVNRPPYAFDMLKEKQLLTLFRLKPLFCQHPINEMIG
ncbi:hypothetical protein CHH80_19375 [Bacillus sp. 7504-2]|nr:hypothetical protein CHH80_19375 [Bacillus sp. 7504-2]